MNEEQGLTFAIIRWNPGFDRARFDRAKSQGILQSSFDSVRKSLDGKKAVVKWRGTMPTEIAGLVLSTGTGDDIRAEMVKPEWESALYDSRPVVLAAAAVFREDVVSPAPTKIPWGKIAAWTAAAAAAAGGLYYYLS